MSANGPSNNVQAFIDAINKIAPGAAVYIDSPKGVEINSGNFKNIQQYNILRDSIPKVGAPISERISSPSILTIYSDTIEIANEDNNLVKNITEKLAVVPQIPVVNPQAQHSDLPAKPQGQPAMAAGQGNSPSPLPTTPLATPAPNTNIQKMVQTIQNVLNKQGFANVTVAFNGQKISVNTITDIKPEDRFAIMACFPEAKNLSGLLEIDITPAIQTKYSDPNFERNLESSLQKNLANQQPNKNARSAGVANPADEEKKPSHDSKVKLYDKLKALGVNVELKFDHLLIKNLEGKMGTENYTKLLKLFDTLSDHKEFPAYRLEGKDVKLYDISIQRLMEDNNNVKNLDSLLKPLEQSQNKVKKIPIATEHETLFTVVPTVTPQAAAAALPHPTPVVVDPRAQFKEIAENIKGFSAEQMGKCGIRDIDTSKINDPTTPTLTLGIACSEDKFRRVYVTPASAEGGVVYSIEKSINPVEHQKVLEGAIRTAVEAAKPGTVLSIPAGADKKCEEALMKAMNDIYGEGKYMVENGKVTVPAERPQKATPVIRADP